MAPYVMALLLRSVEWFAIFDGCMDRACLATAWLFVAGQLVITRPTCDACFMLRYIRYTWRPKVLLKPFVNLVRGRPHSVAQTMIRDQACNGSTPTCFSQWFDHLIRWALTIQHIQCVIMPQLSTTMFDFRRIQLTEQQTEKQKKNILQKCMVFSRRAKELQSEDGSILTSFSFPLLPFMHWSIINHASLQDSAAWQDERVAFMEAINEYNNFGQAAHATRLQIDEVSASQLYGFQAWEFNVVVWLFLDCAWPGHEWLVKTKAYRSFVTRNPVQVGVSKESWEMIETHLHQFRFVDSGLWLKRMTPTEASFNFLNLMWTGLCTWNMKTWNLSVFVPAFLQVSNPASILQRIAAKHAMASGRDTIKLVLCFLALCLDGYCREASISPAICINLCVCVFVDGVAIPCTLQTEMGWQVNDDEKTKSPYFETLWYHFPWKQYRMV